MNTLTYARLVDELFPRLTGGIRWGLERTERLLASVGNPHRAYPSIHVGGTNGKGSVSATASSILRAHGLRVGLYTSPHLCTFRERIQIDGVPVSEDALLAAAESLWPAITAEDASFFEATTAIGFLALANAAVDIAVIEVGLGGRLDSTNVITPLVTVLTNVSLDHVQLLGNTLEAVAGEKAGILKAGVPAVTGEGAGAALEVFRARASAVGAALHELALDAVVVESLGVRGTSFRVHATSDVLHTPLVGLHQARNSALARSAVQLLPVHLRPDAAAIRAGIAAVEWPGRIQVETVAGGMWIFDVAHNVAGVHALLGALERLDLPHPRTVLVGVLGDKDWAGMLTPLQAWADMLILTTPPTAPDDRKWDLERVASSIPAEKRVVIADFADALRAAARGGRAAGADVAGENVAGADVAGAGVAGADVGGTAIVTGSFHTVGDALTMLGRCPHGSDVALPHIDFGG